MSIFAYTGGSTVAMTGKGCVAIGSDLRVGEQTTGLAMSEKKVYKVTDRIYCGLAGLRTDAITISEQLQFRRNLYELRENRAIKPKVVATILSNMLYEHRFGPFFTEPIVAGLDPNTFEPFIAGMDLIGCLTTPRDFVCVGTAQEYMLGVCEAYWKPDMTDEETFEATAQALLCGIERDASTGLGAVVYTISKDKVTIKTIKARMD